MQQQLKSHTDAYIVIVGNFCTHSHQQTGIQTKTKQKSAVPK